MKITDSKKEMTNGVDQKYCECACANEKREKVGVHQTEILGLEVVLDNAVDWVRCSECGASDFSIPNMDGLVAAVAMLRVQEPTKLTGKDIKFLRKAAELTAVTLAKVLEVSPETLSRWENDKAPIGAAPEKLLRLKMGDIFREDAPLIDYSDRNILNMNVRACHSVGRRLILHLELVKHKEQVGSPAHDVYSVSKQEAA